MLMGLRMRSWTAGTMKGIWKAGISQSDAAKEGKKKPTKKTKTTTQAHIKLLNVEERSMVILSLNTLEKAQDLCCAKSQIYKGPRHLPCYWL